MLQNYKNGFMSSIDDLDTEDFAAVMAGAVATLFLTGGVPEFFGFDLSSVFTAEFTVFTVSAATLIYVAAHAVMFITNNLSVDDLTNLTAIEGASFALGAGTLALISQDAFLQPTVDSMTNGSTTALLTAVILVVALAGMATQPR
jgi:hypothetical protein